MECLCFVNYQRAGVKLKSLHFDYDGCYLDTVLLQKALLDYKVHGDRIKLSSYLKQGAKLVLSSKSGQKYSHGVISWNVLYYNGSHRGSEGMFLSPLRLTRVSKDATEFTVYQEVSEGRTTSGCRVKIGGLKGYALQSRLNLMIFNSFFCFHFIYKKSFRFGRKLFYVKCCSGLYYRTMSNIYFFTLFVSLNLSKAHKKSSIVIPHAHTHIA